MRRLFATFASLLLLAACKPIRPPVLLPTATKPTLTLPATDPTPGPGLAFTARPITPVPVWNFLLYDPAQWGVEDDRHLRNLQMPDCLVITDRGTDFKYRFPDWEPRSENDSLLGNPWTRLVFWKKGSEQAEAYGPQDQYSLIFYYTKTMTPYCRMALRELMRFYPFNLTPGQMNALDTQQALSSYNRTPPPPTVTPSPPTWHALRYDPQEWTEQDFTHLKHLSIPNCTIWMDLGIDYAPDLQVKIEDITINGNPFQHWTFLKGSTLVRESFLPATRHFFGHFSIDEVQPECRAALMDLLERFPYTPELLPPPWPTNTLRPSLNPDQILATATTAANQQATWEARITCQAATKRVESTARALTQTPPSPYEACSGARLSRLQPGMSAFVATDPPFPNKVRQQAGKQAKVIDLIQPAETVSIVGGPRCADGWVWWQIEFKHNKTGWTAEGDADTYWLVPCSPTAGCPHLELTKTPTP